MTAVSKETYVLRNKSFTYLLPLLGKDVNNFKNVSAVFMKDDTHPKIIDKVFLLFRMNKDWSDELHDWLTNQNLYDQHYNVVEDYRMYVFDLPEGYEHIYYLFESGLYSVFDDEYKRHLLLFHGRDDNVTEEVLNSVRKVLYRSEDLYLEWEKKLSNPGSPVIISRDQEIGSKPNMEIESFSQDKLESTPNINLTEWE